ncbi:pentatricopeptide repeat-containing protein At4g38010-like [Coffea eugenioides]|uniref:Pentatricopeptide repeat-containing protein At4g38010-like n=1 Tax=Coffea arabica TaxID=13443 RepID=A0A6P6TEB6_COFAR|nr:pentatricopeptide repeat-containing protein At4g38010-like [Coffea eugenioides]
MKYELMRFRSLLLLITNPRRNLQRSPLVLVRAIEFSTSGAKLPNWVSANKFFASCDHSEAALVAFLYYMKMLSSNTFPDKYTFPALLQACGPISDPGLVKQVHSHITKLGPDEDLFLGNSMINAYVVCGAKCFAREPFDQMAEKDVVSRTTLISGLVALGCYGEGVNVFKEMMMDGWTRPNAAAFASVLSACGDLGSCDHAKCLHALLEKAGWIELDVSIRNSLTDAYTKCGSLENATKVFNDVEDSEKDLYTWTAIISGLVMMDREGMHIYFLLGWSMILG